MVIYFILIQRPEITRCIKERTRCRKKRTRCRKELTKYRIEVPDIESVINTVVNLIFET